MDIAILDFGSQYTNLIRALLEDLGISNETLPSDTSVDILRGFEGIIISGGPASVHAPDAPRFAPELFKLDVPILGICYGHQLMAHVLGGSVVSSKSREYGRSLLREVKAGSILRDLTDGQSVWMSHSDTVVNVPDGFVLAATTQTCPVAAMYSEDYRRFGVQFHPEVSQTEGGLEMIERFVVDICGCNPVKSASKVIDNLSEQIVNMVGTRKVFLFLSGGVDSNVAFVLLANALGKNNVLGVHIDTGLLRSGETSYLEESLKNTGLEDRLKVVDASAYFFSALEGLIDAEQKRKAIALAFLDIKDRVMAELSLDPDEWVLAQGTIYTDLITSGLTNNSAVIKTHHNSLLDKRETLQIIEPLRMLFKHQVRRIGVQLGLPESLIWKEPYPGPGNGVRIIGQVNSDRANLQRKVDDILTGILYKYGYHKSLFQGFPVIAFIGDFETPSLGRGIVGEITDSRLQTIKRAKEIVGRYLPQDSVMTEEGCQLVLLPIKTVGIKGDNRSYSSPIVLRFERASSRAKLEYDLLESLSTLLTNELDAVTRVVLDLTESALTGSSWNTLAFLRLITSREAMTVDWARVEYEVLIEISDMITTNTEIDRVMLDVTQKPPGMVEWE